MRMRSNADEHAGLASRLRDMASCIIRPRGQPMKRLALALLFVIAGCAATPDRPAKPYAQDLVQFGVDPASLLESRIGATPADNLNLRYADPQHPIRPRPATPEERRK